MQLHADPNCVPVPQAVEKRISRQSHAQLSLNRAQANWQAVCASLTNVAVSPHCASCRTVPAFLVATCQKRVQWQACISHSLLFCRGLAAVTWDAQLAGAMIAATLRCMHMRGG